MTTFDGCTCSNGAGGIDVMTRPTMYIPAPLAKPEPPRPKTHADYFAEAMVELDAEFPADKEP